MSEMNKDSGAMRPLVVGIDASRNRSGGARAHIIGIIENLCPEQHDIKGVHVWAYRTLLDALPDLPWLHKHCPPALERGLLSQLWWQMQDLAEEARQAGCDILFATDASTLCNFQPLVVLSQDMLSYEKGVMSYFGYGTARLRLLLILFLQNAAFRRARGVIFLTKYAGKVIQSSCGALKRVTYVAHGVGENFRAIGLTRPWPVNPVEPLVCTYVSNTEMYKHQWQVVEAMALLRVRGHNVNLVLVGGGQGQAQALLDAAIRKYDPQQEFVTQVAFVSQAELTDYLAQSNIFIFASSCENQPVTLLEGMAAGLPIACSDRGPMLEVLEDAGTFFDPEKPETIADAVEDLILNEEKRKLLAARAQQIAARYSWSRCASKTFNFISSTYWNGKVYAE
ncbi:Glycosyltransferase involved in cell wall bisynthesis [Janthinobacterium psychrotolerans]|uniref:Glycosyltransferase involved in cell wall bisynthesis n=2 Tax=Oxalobacteraceae TaxID=75682 RepID=A0A1A7C2X9_9BURK|nr:Glycosyltransferase involved in cell wall bisynthesis [Janthinobacterium psychrotolerans]